MPRTLLTGFSFLLLALVHIVAQAADPAFVGVLATAIEDEVATELGLSDDVKAKLLTLVDQRENEAVSLALEIKDLSPEERKARLAPFVAESEKQGLALLTDEQKTRLKQLQVARGGLSTLEDPSVAEAVGLSKTQQSLVNRLLSDLKTKNAKGTEAERRLAKAEAERELAKILTTQQRSAWDALAGLAGPAPAPAAVPEKTSTTADKPKADDATPATLTSEGAKTDNAKPTTRPAAAVAEKEEPPKNPEDVRLTFNFSYTPWKDVLEWFAEKADLSLVADPIPPGTLNYSDRRSYTPAQAIDLMNSHLLVKGYTLVRRERSLFVFNLEDGVPPGFSKSVAPEELDSLGEYELVSCLFTYSKSTPEEIESDVRKLLGPQGHMVVLAKSKHVYIQETAGKLRTIRSVIDAMEDPQAGKNDTIQVFKLKNVLPDDVMAQARPLMGIPEGLTATPDGSFRISVDAVNSRLLVIGRPEQLEKFKKIVETLDVDSSEGVDTPPIETPQLEVYPITSADPDAVLKVLQTILAGQSTNVRLEKDPKTGSIVALATPSQHATIQAVIADMQKDARSFEVIKLKKVDPQVAVIAINKLFGVIEGQQNPSAPIVDADLTASQLFIRGSQTQIDQIRSLLEKMGELPPNGEAADVERSYVRTIPLTGRQQVSAVEQLEMLLPAYLPNKITVRRPSAEATDEVPTRVPVPKSMEKRPPAPTVGSIPRGTDSRSEENRDEDDDRDRDYDRSRYFDRFRGYDRGRDEERGRDEDRDRDRDRDERRSDRSTSTARGTYFVAWQDPELRSAEENAEAAEALPAAKEEPAEATDSGKPPKQKSVPGAEIVVTVTPNGIIIASEDLDALDEAEATLRGIMDTQATSGKEYTIFYLRYARADAASELLQQALGGGGGSVDDGGGSLMGDMMSSMMGGGGMGGIMGSLMGGGGGGGSTTVSAGPVLLIPDNRLNAIIAQGRAPDLDLAESLLKIIDQQASPEDVQVIAKPRFIPVIHTTAEEMAVVVRQVYAARMASDPNVQRQPSPEDLIRALRGGRGGGGGGGGRGGNQRQSEEQKMTVGIDVRSNSLIVSAPDPLYEEVKLMVEQLDIASTQKDEKVEVVSLRGVSPQLVERSLSARVTNATVNVSATPAASSSSSSRNSRSGSNQSGSSSSNRSGQSRTNAQAQQNLQQSFQPNPQQMQDEIRRRLETFNQAQGRRGGGGGGRGGRGR